MRHLLKLRYLAVVVVLVAVLHALTFLFLGIRTAFEAYGYIFVGHDPAAGKQPVLELLHALDFVLVALVMIILALGVANLFLLKDGAPENAALPRWLHINTFSDLKVLLWETILMALLIIGLSALTSGALGKFEWSALVIPTAILLLALSLYFMKRA